MLSCNEKNVMDVSSAMTNNAEEQNYSILDRLNAYKSLSSEKLKLVENLCRLDDALNKNLRECGHELFIFYNEFKTDGPHETGAFYGNMLCPLCGSRFVHIAQQSAEGKCFMVDVTKLKEPISIYQKRDMVVEVFSQLAEDFLDKEGQGSWSKDANERILKMLEETIGTPYYRVRLVK